MPVIAESSDGKVVAVGYTNISHAAVVATVVLHIGKESQNIVTLPGDVFSALSLSTDGNLVSVLSSPLEDEAENVVVYDRKLKKVTLNQTFPYITLTGWCVSANGNYIAHGFIQFSVFARDPSTGAFNLVGTQTVPAPMAFAACSISNNGVLLVAQDDIDDFSRVDVTAYSIGKNAITQLWAWTSGPEPNPELLQDVVTSAAISADGSAFVLSSWGTSGGTPTVRAFLTAPQSGGQKPILEFVTPGSVEHVDIVSAGGKVLVVSGGKNVHANIIGNGGDLYVLQASSGQR